MLLAGLGILAQAMSHPSQQVLNDGSIGHPAGVIARGQVGIMISGVIHEAAPPPASQGGEPLEITLPETALDRKSESLLAVVTPGRVNRQQ